MAIVATLYYHLHPPVYNCQLPLTHVLSHVLMYEVRLLPCSAGVSGLHI